MKTVLITGANRGIGLALTQQFVARGDTVIATCRTSSEALDASGARVISGVDVADAAAVETLAHQLGDSRIDLLFLNAGILTYQRLGELDADAFERIRRQFEVNTLGPLRVVEALSDRLSAGAKIALMTSRMGSIADNSSGGSYGYRASKAALNAVGKSLAVDLEKRGIGVFLLHPGFVQTDMVGGNGDVTPATAAGQLILRMDTLTLKDTGTFWHANGTRLPW